LFSPEAILEKFIPSRNKRKEKAGWTGQVHGQSDGQTFDLIWNQPALRIGPRLPCSGPADPTLAVQLTPVS
jgi:hypothetical protein